MVTIQFGALAAMVNSVSYSIDAQDVKYTLNEVLMASIIIPQASEDNLIEYLAEKFDVLHKEAYDAEFIDAFFTMQSFPNVVQGTSIVKESISDGSADPVYYVARLVTVEDVYDSTVTLRIHFSVEPHEAAKVYALINIALDTKTITSFRISVLANISGELISNFAGTGVQITDTASTGSSNTGSGWTAGDGFREPDNRRYNEDDAVISGVNDLGAQPGWRP